MARETHASSHAALSNRTSADHLDAPQDELEHSAHNSLHVAIDTRRLSHQGWREKQKQQFPLGCTFSMTRLERETSTLM